MNKDEVEAKELVENWIKERKINADGFVDGLFPDLVWRITRLTEKARREGKNAPNPAEFGDVWSRGYKAGLLRARDIVKESKSLLLVDIASAILTEAEASDE